MTCPNCRIAYDPYHWDDCPHCGGGNQPELTGVLRTSTILIAAGDGETEMFGSVDEVPEGLRRALVEATHGINSGTIYIADQNGREQITRALRHLPSAAPDPLFNRFSEAVALDGARHREAGPRESGQRRSGLRLAGKRWLMGLWFAASVLAAAATIVWLAGGRIR